MDDNSASQEPNRILSSSHGTDISMKDNYIFMLKVFILFDMHGGFPCLACASFVCVRDLAWLA